MSENYKEVSSKQFGGFRVPIYQDQSPKITYASSEHRYTHDEVKALRSMAREELLDEMEKRFSVRNEYNLNEQIVEDRLKTYILSGLKP